MQIYEQYLAYQFEREQITVIEHAHGFALVKPLNAEELYLQDFFTDPEHRSRLTTKQLFTKVEEYARSKSYVYLLTTHDIRTEHVELGLMNALRFGFTILRLDGESVIVCVKDLKENDNGESRVIR